MFFRIFITASVTAIVEFQSSPDPWSEVLYYELSIDWEFWFAEFHRVAVKEPWALCIFVSVFTLALWSSALVTFLDECGCGVIVDLFESIFGLLSSSSDKWGDDFDDLPDLFGEDDLVFEATNENESVASNTEDKANKDDYDHLIYHPTYGVIPKGVFKRWNL